MLGFSVEYMNTFDRSEKIIEDGYVNKINEAEIWMADERVQKVAEHIIANHNKKTRYFLYTLVIYISPFNIPYQYILGNKSFLKIYILLRSLAWLKGNVSFGFLL